MGCEWCKNDEGKEWTKALDMELWDSKHGMSATSYSVYLGNGALVVNDWNIDCGPLRIPISYCPFCGEKLGEASREAKKGKLNWTRWCDHLEREVDIELNCGHCYSDNCYWSAWEAYEDD